MAADRVLYLSAAFHNPPKDICHDANNQQVYVKTYENNCLQVFNLKNVDLLDNKLSQFEISHNEETKIIK